MSPMSCMSVKRLTWAGRSMPAKAARNSRSVSGPNVENVTSPPTRSTRPSSASARGRSAAHCSARLLQTRSNAPAANGSAPTSPQTKSRAAGAPPRERREEPRERASAAARPSRIAHASIGNATSSATWRAARIAEREVGLRVARAAARIENRRGRELHDIEALGHPARDFPLQHRGAVVGRRGAREMAAHGARVDRAGIRRRPAAQRASRKGSSAAAKRRRATGTARAPRRGSARSARWAVDRQASGRRPAAPACRARRKRPAPAARSRPTSARRSDIPDRARARPRAPPATARRARTAGREAPRAWRARARRLSAAA